MQMDEDIRNRYRRDYTAEPIRTTPHRQSTPQPQSEEPAPRPMAAEHKVAAKKNRKLKSRLKKMLLWLVILLVLAGGGFFAYTKLHHQAPKQQHFPKAVTDKIKSPLYFPVNLPSGYTLNNDFQVVGQNVVTYSLLDDRQNKYVVAIQPLPPSLDMNQQKGKFLKPDEFNTTYGNALVGTAGADLLALIRTNDNGLIIIHALNSATQKQLEVIVRSLQESK